MSTKPKPKTVTAAPASGQRTVIESLAEAIYEASLRRTLKVMPEVTVHGPDSRPRT
jgi:hypothetical protein